MELTVGGKPVLLTTHKAYCEVNELQSLRAFAQYPPLCTYLTECEKNGPIPDAVVVRHLERVAHRITGAVVDLIYGGTSTARVLRLTNARPAVLLPIVAIEERRYAVLVQQVELSQGLKTVTTAMRGIVDAEGGFANDTYTSALARAGVRIADASPLSFTDFTIGNEGEPAVRFFTLTTTCNAEQAEQLRQNPDLALVALKDVFASGDAAASLAVSLVLATTE
ncbi:conserved hypothetical protein [Leishmania braziliensis MHOM/BR/75/M2904]|uniref:Uncharacterized protein n=4 Tax=Viannia TaxID=37616 RepID=A4H9R4_LEIBR|nr:conserved hypothetical protein [Leishmania braziliensis MHOM/BR/75/M2904]KAI5691080.1 hypothetical protein MNV84_02643 [Leishmania braziliensis]CAJ2470518.1 unnamed protein product [Leishmania braziliensis]CAJ2471026.1 unnamed protein product [Leishmania braziliensis]CAM38140.1 conserved hypothetical protein [Leishmania braziliensis MHOM/BR/75/M2904]SYZ64801.1 hypothetical_protein [Leishmania braziliensis MHOM/BR/75/M2904]